MANSVQIGDIVVRLIADSKQLDSELKKAGANLDTLGKKGKQAGQDLERSFAGTSRLAGSLVTRLAGLAAAFVSVNSVVQTFTQHVANVTSLDQLSQATGISIERLSELRNVALATGTEFNVLSQAASQFATRMTEGLASSTSRLSQAVRALGIDVRDSNGNLRSFEDVLGQVAERFPQYADGANKAAIAAALFGEEAGPRLVALLNRGRAGLEDMRRQLGATITAADAEAVRNYHRAVAELQVAMDRLLIPALTRAVETLTALSRIPGVTADAFAAVNRQAAEVQARIAVLNQELARHFQRLAEGQITEERYLEIQRRIGEELERQAQRLRDVNRERIGAFTTTVTPHRPEAPAMDPFALERAQIQLQQLMERLTGTRSIFDSVNLSWQEHSNLVQRAIAQIDKAHDQAHRRQAARYNLERQLQLRQQEQMLQTATTAAQTITMLWPKSKGAAIASAIINTAVGVTRALSSMDPPWSFVTAALIAAQGAAQIAAIRSTNEDGSGGSGATPQAPVAAEGAPMGRSLTISGIDPASIFSGGQVRGLIDQINDEVRNGATLISTGTLPL